MNKDLEKKLSEKFPILYKNLYKKNTCMMWGIQCDDGWYNIIHDLSSEIDSWCEKNKLKIEALQVKEKFGTLRFYIGLCEDSSFWNNDQYNEISNIIKKYEDLSAKTCELTGNVGELKIKGYLYKTLCKESAILLEFNDVKNKSTL